MSFDRRRCGRETRWRERKRRTDRGRKRKRKMGGSRKRKGFPLQFWNMGIEVTMMIVDQGALNLSIILN